MIQIENRSCLLGHCSLAIVQALSLWDDLAGRGVFEIILSLICNRVEERAVIGGVDARMPVFVTRTKIVVHRGNYEVAPVECQCGKQAFLPVMIDMAGERVDDRHFCVATQAALLLAQHMQSGFLADVLMVTGEIVPIGRFISPNAI